MKQKNQYLSHHYFGFELFEWWALISVLVGAKHACRWIYCGMNALDSLQSETLPLLMMGCKRLSIMWWRRAGVFYMYVLIIGFQSACVCVRFGMCSYTDKCFKEKPCCEIAFSLLALRHPYAAVLLNVDNKNFCISRHILKVVLNFRKWMKYQFKSIDSGCITFFPNTTSQSHRSWFCLINV